MRKSVSKLVHSNQSSKRGATRQKTRQPSRQPSRWRYVPTFESLEDRRLLSGFSIKLISGPSSVQVYDGGPNDSNPTPGIIVFSGSFSVFNISVTSAQSKPAVGDSSYAQLLISDVQATSSVGGSLEVWASDTDFLLDPASGNSI